MNLGKFQEYKIKLLEGQFLLDLQENMDEPLSSQVDSLFPQSMNTVQIVFTQTGICGLAGLALIPVHFTCIYICITVWGVLFLSSRYRQHFNFRCE